MDICYNPVHCFIPPYVVEHMAESDDPAVRRLAVEAIKVAAEARAIRNTLATMPVMAAVPSPAARKHRLIYDMKHKTAPFPGNLVRSEGQKKVKDPVVNEAYDNAGQTYDFYKQVFERNSIDGIGMSLISSVHMGQKVNNAFWNGEQMIYGDGDGELFISFTKSLDVAGHEITHGVVMHESNLIYQDESGALNEHFADVMGSLVTQWRNRQTAKRADCRRNRLPSGSANRRERKVLGPNSRTREILPISRETGFGVARPSLSRLPGARSPGRLRLGPSPFEVGPRWRQSEGERVPPPRSHSNDNRKTFRLEFRRDRGSLHVICAA